MLLWNKKNHCIEFKQSQYATPVHLHTLTTISIHLSGKVCLSWLGLAWWYGDGMWKDFSFYFHHFTSPFTIAIYFALSLPISLAKYIVYVSRETLACVSLRKIYVQCIILKSIEWLWAKASEREKKNVLILCWLKKK